MNETQKGLVKSTIMIFVILLLAFIITLIMKINEFIGIGILILSILIYVIYYWIN
jgi:hypothetical protein